eukprot:Sro473_g150140.2  (339) ;mRNA; r:41459-42646
MASLPSTSGLNGVVAASTASGKKPQKEVKKKRQFRARKPKDMPRRPLSAYNIFFKEERARLLAERQAQGAAVGGEKIGFEKMAKTIGKRWKSLTEQELGRFKVLANEDTERYRKEMDAYNHELAMKGRRQREESSRKRADEEKARTQPSSAGLPTPQQQQPAESTNLVPQNSQGMGQLAGSHLLGLVSANNANPVEQQLASAAPAAGATNPSQLDQLLAGAFQPGLQGLRDLIAAKRENMLQDRLLFSNLVSQQQQQPGLPSNGGQLAQSFLSQALPNATSPAANHHQSVIASLPPRLQQQLLIQSLQQAGHANSILNAFSGAGNNAQNQDNTLGFPF